MAAARRFAVSLAILLTLAYALMILGGPRAAAQEESNPQTLWGVYWTVQPGFTSTLEMKNNRIGEAVVVRVSLYFASGEKCPLAPVVLGPRQVAVIDLNQVIETLPQPVAARASKEGTMEVAFDAENAAAVMGSVSVRNPERGIAWNFFLWPTGYWPQPSPTPLQSVFWFPNSQTDGFVAIQNVSEGVTTVTPRFHVAGAAYEGTPVAFLAGQGHKLELRRELQRLGLNQVTAGGIEVVYQGAPGAVLAHGVLFDSHGFSAEMDFMPHETWEEKTDFFYRAPRVAFGRVDPALGLPPQTVFKPTLALHNFNVHPLNVNLAFGPSGGATPQPTAVPLTLAAGETREVDLYTVLQNSGAAGPWANLELSYSDWHTNLGMMLVSVSGNGEHSVRSVLNWVEAATREGWYWQADANTNTLLGIQNSDTEAATVRVALDYYAEGTRHSYELPDLSIVARGSALVNIGEIVASGTPDADGDVIPPGVTFGGYRARKVGPNSANITTEVLIVDRQQKTYLSMYNTGCCYTLPITTPYSLTGSTSDSGPLYVKAKDCGGGTVDFIQLSAESGSDVHVTFESDNATVADVGFTSGVYALQQPGSTTLRSTSLFPYQNNLCRRKTWYGSCAVTVNPPPCATPTNLVEQFLGAEADGTLRFRYTWSSSTGNQADLASCTVGESVFYPGSGDPYVWPLPMVASSRNPTVISGPGNSSEALDRNFPPDGYQEPYSPANFDAAQRFWWSCPCYQNGEIQYFGPDTSISRKVFKDTDNLWKYQIDKSSYTTKIQLPNQ